MSEFKLVGTTEQKFQALNKILPRLRSRMFQTKEIIHPDTMMSFYCPTVADGGLIFSFCTFQATIKKICFNIENIVGKEKPSYECTLSGVEENRTFKFQTKKTSHVQQLNLSVNVGDILQFRQVNDDLNDPHLSNIHVSILMSLTLNDVEKQIVALEDSGF